MIVQVNPAHQSRALIAAKVPRPEPAEAEVLIQVYGAGVAVADLLWYPTFQWWL